MPASIEKISRLAYEHFGLDLRGCKQGLVAARLGKKLRELGLTSFQHYYDYVKADRSGDCPGGHGGPAHHQSHQLLPRAPGTSIFSARPSSRRLRARSRIHIWSAACSSGEEPYSIAMSLLEEAPREAGQGQNQGYRHLHACAREGHAAASIRRSASPASHRCCGNAICSRPTEESADSFRFKSEVRSMIEFEHVNLMGRLPEGYRCSVLFCRNIMIYFDKPTQQSLVERLSRTPGGWRIPLHRALREPEQHRARSRLRLSCHLQKAGPHALGPNGRD